MRWTRTIERLVCDKIRSGMTQVEIDGDSALPSMVEINRRRQVNERFDEEYDKADEARLLAWYERALEDMKRVEHEFQVAMEDAALIADGELRSEAMMRAQRERRAREITCKEHRDFLKFCLTRRSKPFAARTAIKSKGDDDSLPVIKMVKFSDA